MADEAVLDAVVGETVETPVVESVVDSTDDSGLTPNATQETAEAVVDTTQQAAATQEPDEEEFPSGLNESLTVKALNEKLIKNPALAAVVNADPALKNLLYSTARQASKASEFKSIFATADTAKTALALAQKQMEFNTASQKGGEAVLQFLHDSDKNKYIETVSSYRTVVYDTVLKSGHPKAAEAIATFAEIMGDRVPQGVSAQSGVVTQTQNELPPDVQERLRLADQYEQERNQQQERDAQQFNSTITTETNSIVESDIAKVLTTIKGAGNSAITPYVETMLKKAVLQEINELAAKDPAYKQHIQFIYSNASKDSEGKAKIIAAARAYAKEHLMTVTRKHLSEFSKPVLHQQTEKNKKMVDQVNRPNVQGAGGASTPSRPGITEQINDFVKANKRQPTNRELLDFD